MLDRDADLRDLAIELVLYGLEFEVPHEHPSQGTRQDQANGHDAGCRGEKAKPQAQLPSSSSR